MLGMAPHVTPMKQFPHLTPYEAIPAISKGLRQMVKKLQNQQNILKPYGDVIPRSDADSRQSKSASNLALNPQTATHVRYGPACDSYEAIPASDSL